MKLTLAVLCGLILLTGVPLIYRAWPPLPAPAWSVVDTDANGGLWYYELSNGSFTSVTIPGAKDINGSSVFLVPPGYTCRFESVGANTTSYVALCEPSR